MKNITIILNNSKKIIEMILLAFLSLLLSTNLSFAQEKYDDPIRETTKTIENNKVTEINITNVYPTSSEIPENLLRFYVYFDSPMREGNALSHIKLFDEKNNELSHIFFDGVHELWTPDHKRLTVLLDPGRVKTGLDANAAMGRAFTAEKKYKLVIDRGFEALNGLLVTKDYEKNFTAIREDRNGLSINQWSIDYPKLKTDSLKIDFKESVDHVSAMVFILVVDHKGDVISGSKKLQQNEKEYVFKPTFPWAQGSYRILINHRFEDIAANNINGAFDHKVGSLVSLNEGEVSSIEFNIP